MGRSQDRRADEEKERRYYQGPSERISLKEETEYMTASQLTFVKSFKLPLAKTAGSIHVS